MLADFDQARKRLREKLGLPTIAGCDAAAAIAAAPQTVAAPLVSVMHRVLEFEDKRQLPDTEITPLPDALSHSLSGSWKQLVLDTGKPAWQRDERECPPSEVVNSSEPAGMQLDHKSEAVQQQDRSHAAAHHQQQADDTAGSGSLLLQLPEVHTVQQARQQVDHLQQQAYFKTRKLHEAKFLARQAAEQLLARQMQDQNKDRTSGATATALVQQQAQALDVAQAHMMAVSEQVSVAELATELAEARASFMERASEAEVPDTPHDSVYSSNAPYSGSMDRAQQAVAQGMTDRGTLHQESFQQGSSQAYNPGSSASAMGQALPGGGLTALKLVLNRPNQSAGLCQLSSMLNADSKNVQLCMSPMSEPMTPGSTGFDRSLSAPATPAQANAAVPTQSAERSSVYSCGGSASVNNDSSAATATSAHEANDCESTSGTGEDKPLGSTLADDHEDDLSVSELPPLPDVPVVGGGESGAKARAGVGTSKYVHIGCAIACLCVFALWAKDASAVSLTSRMFPT